MKIFKFALITLLTTLICLAPTFQPVTVKAETSRYAYVGLGVTAYMCSEKDAKTAVFAIPETYCVEILREEGSWYYCSYARDEGSYRKVKGYCAKSDLILTAEPLENEYLNLTMTVKFYAEESSSQIPPMEIELSAAYYGKGNVNDAPQAYVYCSGTFGYVTDTVLNDFPRNGLPQPTVAPGPENNGDNATWITAIVIIIVAAGAIAVLFFVGKKPKLPPNTEN